MWPINLKAEDLTADLFGKIVKSMAATAKRELEGEAWRMDQKQEAELPSGVFELPAEQPKADETLADLRHFCPVTDPWVSWDEYDWSEAPAEGQPTAGDVADWLLADLS